MATYPCPACGASATLDSDCPGCGRAPDPAAAEVVRLNGEVDRLRRELVVTTARRDELAAAVRARVLAERQAMPAPPVAPALVPAPAVGPETSTNTVQTVLFALGGLLLGIAAIVFTAVAWATFGQAGRAAILGTVTAVALALPVLAQRRGLSATAETFASLGLLLVILDGYAARAVNLFGVAEATGPYEYAAGVCALTAAIGAGYGRATGLLAPRLAAALAAQPVLPLLATRANLEAPEWGLVYATVAIADLAALWRRPRRELAGLLWSLYAVALAAAGAYALAVEALAGTPAEAARAGAALIATALVLLGGALRAGAFRTTAGAVLTLAVALAAGRFGALAWPQRGLIVVAAVVAALALAARVLPAGTGPRIGAGIALAAVGPVVAGLALFGAVLTAAAALPAWHADLRRPLDLIDVGGGGVPIAIALVALGVAALAPRAAWPAVAVPAAALVALAVPTAAHLPWWVPATVDLEVAVPLALLAARRRSARAAALCGVTAAALAGHAVLAGLGRPAGTAMVVWTIAAAGALTAGLALPVRGNRAGGPALGLAILALPFATAATVVTYGGSEALMWRLSLAAATAGVVALAATRRYARPYLPAAALGTAAALAGTGLVPAASGEPVGVYAAIGLALLATVDHRVAAVAALVPGVRLVLATGPAVVALLAAPYAWLGDVWAGAPAGVGLSPSGSAEVPAEAAVALAIAALAAAVGGAAVGRWRGAAVGALLVGPVAALAAAAGAGAPWPVVPALSLALGLAGALVAGLTRGRLPGRGPLTAQAVLLAGAGLAGLLATEAGTLSGLGALLVASAVIASAGRSVPVRVAGGLVRVVAGVLAAIAATRAAELPPIATAYALLGVATLALAAGAWRTGVAPVRVEGPALEAAAHAAALLAFGWANAVAVAEPERVLRHGAGMCALWGVAVGLRALWPGLAAPRRHAHLVAAAGLELLAWWLLLGSRRIDLIEAYTLPAAALALAAGWLALRRRPELRSWAAYGPALGAAFGPSLAAVLTVPGDPLRRLLLGAGALAVVVGGAVRRRQAPVVLGGAVLALVGLHELVLVWDLLPRWIPLATAGLLLVGLAMTYERRRRDMDRMRAAIGRMS